MVKKQNAVIADLKRRLIDAIGVLSAEGVLNGSGHLSAKIPGTETFLINPRYAGILADPADLCIVDFLAKELTVRSRFLWKPPFRALFTGSAPTWEAFSTAIRASASS